MPRRILADTGPLYANALARDSLHARAREELESLKAERYTLVVAYPVLLETQKLILRRAHPGFAAQYIDALLAGCMTINPSAEDYRSGASLAKRYGDQQLSLFDTTLAVLSERLSIPIWTFDADFDVLGAAVWRKT